MRKGEWDWLKLWDRTVAWGSVLPTEEWKRPDRILGAFLIVTPKVRPPPPLRCFRLRGRA